MTALSTRRIAGSAARRPWLTVAVWVVVTAVAGLAATGLGGVLTNEIGFANQPEARRAAEALDDVRGGEVFKELVIVRSSDHTIEDPEFAAFVAPIVSDIRALADHIDASSTVSYFELPLPTLVSDDRTATIIPVTLRGDLDQAEENVVPLLDVAAEYDGVDGFEVVVGGTASVNREFTETARRDLETETKVLPIALVVLILVFGAVVAALLPLGLAFLAVALALAGATLIGQAFALSIFVTNMIFLIGLAVGIDYALFIVARFREERASGRDKLDAIEVAADTATRAVVFSGLTVVVALLGMFIVPTTLFRSLATGAILAVLGSLAVTLTLLPAVLSLLGDRVDRLSIPLLRRRRDGKDAARSIWARTARWVMRRPVVSMAASATLLVALAIPYFSIELGASGAGSLPEGTESARTFEILGDEFEVGRLEPTEIVVIADDVAAPAVQAGLTALVESVASDADFGEPTIETLSAEVALLSVPLQIDAASEQATSVIDRLRSEFVPAAFSGSDAEVLVGGAPGLYRDWFGLVDDYTPIVFAFVLGLSFLLLMVVFRSIVVPIKAIIMNLLSVGAAYGLMVLVFQEGVGAGALGFQQVDAIEAWVPLFLFTVLFGLSMDYHVFLLSRIRERFDLTGDNEGSVAFGIRTTAGIITGAAAIMVVVFTGFAFGDLVMFQQLGFGLAFAVFLDATIVRIVLVPATMRLLGRRNWYLPGWLRWLPDWRVEGSTGVLAAAAPIGASPDRPGSGEHRS